MAAGRAPTAPDEVALGAVTMRQTDVDLGESIDVEATTLAGDSFLRRLHVVGRVVLPLEQSAGRGALVVPEVLQSIEVYGQWFVVRIELGADRAAAFAELHELFYRTVVLPYPPDDVRDLVRLRQLPSVLAALICALAAAAAPALCLFRFGGTSPRSASSGLGVSAAGRLKPRSGGKRPRSP
jgi:hypothetical protein